MLRTVLESYVDVTATLHWTTVAPWKLHPCNRSRFTSVMIDASRSTEDDEPNDFESNVAAPNRLSRRARTWCQCRGELGTIGGLRQVDRRYRRNRLCRSLPGRGVRVRTGVDALAVAVGTSTAQSVHRRVWWSAPPDQLIAA